MTKDNIFKIINDEKLMNYNLYGDHDVSPNEVVIRIINGKWSVYTADERNSIMSEELYDNESDALDDFIERLRADKVLREL